MTEKTIGRDPSCDVVIFDPQKRVSRKHAVIHVAGSRVSLKDLGSTNGTFVNGKKIAPSAFVSIKKTDKVTLSTDYKLNTADFFVADEEMTMVMGGQSTTKQSDATLVFDNSRATFKAGKQTVIFDKDKTQIGEIASMDNSPFLSIGRQTDCGFVINNDRISKRHCQIRMLTPVMIEIEDLGSTNGTFVDDERLEKGKRFQYSSSAKVRLAGSVEVDLKKLFPGIVVVKKEPAAAVGRLPNGSMAPPNANSPLTDAEKKAFDELEEVWKEYQSRGQSANTSSMGFSIGGSVLGLAAAAFTGMTGGIGGILLMSGGGLLGRYLGQQQSNKIRNDLTYEDIFLATYSCPRCKESFQKKPWVTIRDCFKCKVKFK
jgi:pSer/pThr/pTyr-binding forkhead associated (FHA) protein